MFFIVYRFTVKSLLMLLLTLFQISFYFSSNSSLFIKKDMYLVHQNLFYIHSFLEALYITLGFNFFFIIFVANKIFNIFFTERNLASIYYFINIYIIYQNWAFVVKFTASHLLIPSIRQQ